MTKTDRSGFIGNWRITGMEAWDAEYFDMEVPAFLTIRKDLTGEFSSAWCRRNSTARSNRWSMSPLEFSWSGFDENDPVSWRGWFKAVGDQAEGRIFIHLGDVSGFKAERVG